MILEGFGDKICQLIDKKLEKFLLDGGLKLLTLLKKYTQSFFLTYKCSRQIARKS